jgi:hypothetical protein
MARAHSRFDSQASVHAGSRLESVREPHRCLLIDIA